MKPIINKSLLKRSHFSNVILILLAVTICFGQSDTVQSSEPATTTLNVASETVVDTSSIVIKKQEQKFTYTSGYMRREPDFLTQNAVKGRVQKGKPEPFYSDSTINFPNKDSLEEANYMLNYWHISKPSKNKK